MAVAAKRTCRTCPAVIAEYGDTGQCRPCQGRSAAIREVVRPEQPASLIDIVKPPRSRDCVVDGHHACEHFQAFYRYLKDFLADCDWCPICGVEAEGDDDIVHQTGCALIVLINDEEPER